MLALALAFAIGGQQPDQVASPPPADKLGEVVVVGDKRGVFCIRNEARGSRIRRPAVCRTQAEWSAIAAAREEAVSILFRYGGRYAMDSSLVEEGIAQARANALAAEARRSTPRSD